MKNVISHLLWRIYVFCCQKIKLPFYRKFYPDRAKTIQNVLDILKIFLDNTIKKNMNIWEGQNLHSQELEDEMVKNMIESVNKTRLDDEKTS